MRAHEEKSLELARVSKLPLQRALSQLERERLEFTISHVPGDAQTALEIGFGDFRMTNRLKALLPTVSLDLPRAIPSGSEARGLVFGTIETLPFADREFNVTVCCEVLTAQKRNILGYVVERLLWRWQARTPRRPIWLLVRLERVGGTGDLAESG